MIAEKGSSFYLEQISKNSNEKIDYIVDFFQEKQIKNSKEIKKERVLELGVGGGESMRALKKATEKMNVEIIGVDNHPDVVANNKEGDLETIQADASELPFESSSILAINASAVLHEIFSYGSKEEGNRKAGGIEEVKKTL